jgi:hypothetical protein
MAIAACAFYICWFTIQFSLSSPGNWHISFVVAFVFSFCLAAALIPTALLWIGVAWAYHKTRIPGATYFSCAGAILLVILGCAAFSLSPKPLFIEDQTFFEGLLIAIERQRICLLLAGALMGYGYWLIAEREHGSLEKPLDSHNRQEPKNEPSSAI